jgi:RNA recognition motif-containing protein
MEKLNGYALEDGKNLYVAPFQRKSERQNELRRIQEENLNRRSNNLCLYISNLDIMVDEKILEALFTKFGKVTKTHVRISREEIYTFVFILIHFVDSEKW